MFDIGFSELLVIGVVALLVIGPERMPKVARTAGHLFGRFQRYVNTVKADIGREVELDELRKAGQNFKESVEQAVRGVESSAAEAEFTMRDEVVNPTDKVLKSMMDMEQHNPVLTPEVEKLQAEQAQAQNEQAQGEQRPNEGPASGQAELELEQPAHIANAYAVANQSEPVADKNSEKPA